MDDLWHANQQATSKPTLPNITAALQNDPVKHESRRFFRGPHGDLLSSPPAAPFGSAFVVDCGRHADESTKKRRPRLEAAFLAAQSSL